MTLHHKNFVIPKKTLHYYEDGRRPCVGITRDAREILERWKRETNQSYTNLVSSAIFYAEQNRVGW